MFMKLFIPDMYQKDIFTIPYQKLKEMGYQLLIFDLDNTIGSIKEKNCNLETINFLNQLSKDFLIVIASNSHKKRVQSFCRNLKCKYYSLSLKPTLKVLRKIKKDYNIDYQKMVIIGDQVVTDILVGNRKKILTILVDPILNYDLKITGFNRLVEKILNKKNGIIKGQYYEKK